MGTYALGQPTSGLGIRTQRYSTDPAVNTWTYASINGMAVPHGVGSVWAQGAWEVYWKLVDKWGFDPNFYNAQGSAGNQRAMLYVVEGLKNTACNPTFTQIRDGIIAAAMSNHGGEDVCRMWEAFAAYGLGTNAVSGGANSTAPINGFKDAREYYRESSAGPMLGAIRRPTLLIHAEDDPWIPAVSYRGIEPNPNLISLMPRSGGHVGFHTKGTDVPWHDLALSRFIGALR